MRMNSWNKILQQIVKEYNRSPNDFLRKKTISRTIHPNIQKLASQYYNDMKKNHCFQKQIFPHMLDSSFGNPFKFKLMSQCSPTTICHTYYLYIINNYLNIFIPNEITHLIEVGGGYGNLARLCRSYGYCGKYSIIDFPEMNVIQKTYLKHNSITNVHFYTLNDSWIPNEEDISMLISAYSINEMPLITRKVIEPLYQHFNYLFFAYNSSFGGVDNFDYFDMLSKNILQQNFNIKKIKNKHKNHYFLMGIRKF